jgi:hypothetical protein
MTEFVETAPRLYAVFACGLPRTMINAAAITSSAMQR